jgi:hypothetical protein
MAKKVHHGQLVGEYLDEHCFNKSGVARKAGLSKQRLNDLLGLPRIEREKLENLSKAVNYDFIAAIERKEQDVPMSDIMVSDAPALYGVNTALYQQLMEEVSGLRKSVPLLVKTNAELWEKYQSMQRKMQEMEAENSELRKNRSA